MLALVLVALPGLVFGQEIPDMTRGVVDAHILPRFENLAQQSKHLANTAHADCRTNPHSCARHTPRLLTHGWPPRICGLDLPK